MKRTKEERAEYVTRFAGFDEPKTNYSKLPHQFIEALPQIETMAEMKVILYVLRHTWGYHDHRKRISLGEFAKGRRCKPSDKNGFRTRLDGGTGMSINSIRDGIERAIAHGFLVIDEQDLSDKARPKTYYALNMAEQPDDEYPDDDDSDDESDLDSRISISDRGVSTSDMQQSETDIRTKKDTLERNLEKDITPPKAGGASPLSGNGHNQAPRGAVAREVLATTEERVGFDDLDRDTRGQAPKGMTSEIARALAGVCGQSIKLNRGKFMSAAKRLLAADKQATVEQVEQNYLPGGWYWEHDWRGQRGQKPTLTAINETWGQWNQQAHNKALEIEQAKEKWIGEHIAIVFTQHHRFATIEEARADGERAWAEYSQGRF